MAVVAFMVVSMVVFILASVEDQTEVLMGEFMVVFQGQRMVADWRRLEGMGAHREEVMDTCD
jgi:hypothetical protein